METTMDILKNHLLQALWETFYMVLIATVIGVVLGGLIGLLLYLTANSLFFKNTFVNTVVGFIVNSIRSLPFLILMVVLIPFVSILFGDPYTPIGGSVSLTIAAIPFYARISEGAFSEVDEGVLEAAVATGAGTLLIIREVLLPESLPSLIRGLVLTIISLLGYSAMVGTIGAGGIGDLAIQYGYNRYETGVLFTVILLLIIIVQLIQWLGDFLAEKVTK